MKPYMEPLLLIIAIIIGSLTGLFSPLKVSLVDFFIIAMLLFLFYNVSFEKLVKGIKNKKYLSIAWIVNFILIPSIAFLLASVFVDRSSAVFIGLIFYLVAPCTDWFLGFTKLANGDVEVNSALLPINLFSQIVLLPVYLYLFTANSMPIPFDAFFDVLLNWVLLPFVIAQVIRFMIKKSNKEVFEKSSSFSELAMIISLTLLIFSIFNSSIESLITQIALLPTIFVVIGIFFVITYFLVKFISRKARFSKKEEVSLTMTTTARNSPLMLGISLALFPQGTVIHLVLILGVLIEIPLLVTITYLLKRQ